MQRTALRQRDAYRWWRSITTRWSDNDAYGHVNNAVYYQWFDTAVNAWLIEAGLLDLTTGDPIGLVVETRCRYAHPLSYPDPVEIGIAIERLGTSSVTYRLGAFVTGALDAVAEASFTHVCVDRATRRPVGRMEGQNEGTHLILRKAGRTQSRPFRRSFSSPETCHSFM